MLEKTFDPKTAEPRLYKAWEESGAFQPSGEGEPFSIVIPPPNVTGSLHIGHALNNTLQDVLCRFHRMKGKRVLWQPGTDHAGIATQMVVERQMAANQEPGRREIGREAFLEKVWQWKEESGGTILNQLKRLGASCDWSRERFTMDEGLSAAVRKVFVEMYEQGLIYRAKRLVNWDPKFQTAISDLEVENTEVNGHMWHFKYPLEGGATYTYVEKDEDGNITLSEERDYISIATTRPETMLGDGAVAVHPDDERYAPIVGKLCEIPVGPKEHRRLIPIITDEYPDPDFGSGAVKITGAHDENDYGVAERNSIPMYRLMDEKAAMRADGAPYADASMRAREIAAGADASAEEIDGLNLVPEAYRGLDRYEARKRVVADIDADGLMIAVEDKKIMQPFGDRSGVVIEPMLTDQWYVDAKTLAKPAIAAVKQGKTRFVPENWSKTYFNWMDNIEPWCISRQLWWGHRIPVWYGPDGAFFVAYTENEAQAKADDHYGKAVALTQDEDVLDTWFSSGLWPFSTMGWPEKTAEVETFYPTSVLVTAFDIIFFWVARMMMQGIHFMEEIPFHDVYIHALVRDEDGAKMSKTKGNVLDPLDIIDGCDRDTLVEKRMAGVPDPKAAKKIGDATKKQFPNGIEPCGADALRFTLTAMAAQGRDIRLSVDRIIGYRNFGTKVWNAARFAEMNECKPVPGWDPASAELTVSRWIIGEVAATAGTVTEALEGYRFNDAASAVYKFAWNTFCDWYLELSKPVLSGEDGPAKTETRACTAWALDQLLIMLHPFSPFITEELWANTTGEAGRETLLISEAWPEVPTDAIDPAARNEIGWLVRFISEIRSIRAEMNVPVAAKPPVRVFEASAETRERLARHDEVICRLARAEDVKPGRKQPEGAVQTVVDEARVVLGLKGFVDFSAEADRLRKEVGKVDGEITRLVKKLSNEKFVANAPDEVVAAEREKQADYEAQKAKLEGALKRVEEAV